MTEQIGSTSKDKRSAKFWGVVISTAILASLGIGGYFIARDTLITQGEILWASRLPWMIGSAVSGGVLFQIFGGKYRNILDKFVKRYYWIGFILLGVALAINYLV